MLKHFHFPSTNKYYHKNWASNIDHKKTEPIRVSDIDTMSTHTLRDFHHGWANLQMPCSLADEDSDLLTVPKFCLLTLRLGKMRYCSRFKWVKLTTQNQQKHNSLLHSFCHRLKTHHFRLHLHPKIKKKMSLFLIWIFDEVCCTFCNCWVVSKWLNALIISCFGQKHQLNKCNVTP